MVRGFYQPPAQGASVGAVQGSDPSGDTGVTIADGQTGLRTDGISQLEATTSGVTMRVPYVAIDATDSPFTAQITDFLILVDSTAGAVEISLPSAVTAESRQFIIKDKGSAASNAITVTASSGNIDGLSSVSIANSYASLPVVSDGSDYWVIY